MQRLHTDTAFCIFWSIINALASISSSTTFLPETAISFNDTNESATDSNGSLLSINTDAKNKESDVSRPVTFTTRDSFLELPSWESSRAGSLSIKIRTNEANGVLVYNSGANNGIGQSSDFFAFEMLDGHIYLLLNLGSGAVKVKATARRVDDGHWHTLSLRRTGRSGRVTVDESAVDFISPGSSNQLDLEGPLFVGGVGTHSTHASKASHLLPPELWSGSLKYGYVGCVRELVVNGNAVDIAAFAQIQDSGSIRPECHTLPPQCEDQCLNGGDCVEGWNRFTCDCSMTSFTGSVCAKEATTLSFNGEQYMNIMLGEEWHTQAEYIQLRFRTMRPNGLILTTSSNDKSMTHLTVSLESGRLKVSVNFGEGIRIAHIGSSLNDDQWHTLKIERLGSSIEIKLDKETQLAELTGQLITLHIDSIHIGAYVHELRSHQSIGHSTSRDVTNFVGLMENFIMNGNYYFEMARDGQISNFKVTARFGKKERIVHHPVTFKSKYTFIGLPQLKAYSTINLYFQFKTLEPNGLILYNAGKGQDFIAIELVNGHINYLFNLGDGPRKVRSNTRTTLNDNRWHAITIGRPSTKQHTLMVDDFLATISTTGSNLHLDLDGLLYLGGARSQMYESMPKLIQSKHGYEGCIASLDFNGETLDPSGSDALIPSTLVAKGCAGPLTRCSSIACANRGICIYMWNSYTCDCDMTSYTGPTCADGNESTAYEFGLKNGLIRFTFPADKRPDTKNDLLALGFLTSIDNAILVRIESGTSSDYMELKLVDGNPQMVYNLGTEDHDIGEFRVKVNDGKYHIVRFTRSSQNSTIQVDNHNVITNTPAGRQLTIFNSHSKVEIGGKKNTIRDSIEKPFHGIISGFVFNGHRLLDLAVEDDPRVTVEGDVKLLMSITSDKGDDKNIRNQSLDKDNKSSLVHSDPQMQQAKSSSAYDGDDLIFSGEGSGCWDDEDECSTGIDSGSGDDLITPVYVSSSKPITTIPPHYRSSTLASVDSSAKICDDEEEDCFDGSGSSESFTSTISSHKVQTHTQPGHHHHHHRYHYTTRLPWPTWSPPSPPPPSQSSTIRSMSVTSDYDSIYHIHRPVVTAPSKSEAPTYEITGPSRYPTHRPQAPHGVPTIMNVPKIDGIPKTAKEEVSPKLPKSTNDRTAMIIGVIAIGLIIVVIIAPIVLFVKVKYRNGGAYKIDETKNFQFAPVSGTPPLLGAGVQQTHLLNGASRTSPTEHHKPLLKMPKKKDLKEWYV